jgi:hypothetical protein
VPALLPVLLVLALLGWGCGKKEWPSPVLEQDRFAWQEVEGRRDGRCLDIRAVLSGDAGNLETVVLELEASREPCQGCPFQKTGEVRLAPSSEQMVLKGRVLRIRYCGLDPSMRYRWRLTATNVFEVLGSITTSVHGPADEKERARYEQRNG